jgi:hypothetical protein
LLCNYWHPPRPLNSSEIQTSQQANGSSPRPGRVYLRLIVGIGILAFLAATSIAQGSIPTSSHSMAIDRSPSWLQRRISMTPISTLSTSAWEKGLSSVCSTSEPDPLTHSHPSPCSILPTQMPLPDQTGVPQPAPPLSQQLLMQQQSYTIALPPLWSVMYSLSVNQLCETGYLRVPLRMLRINCTLWSLQPLLCWQHEQHLTQQLAHLIASTRKSETKATRDSTSSLFTIDSTADTSQTQARVAQPWNSLGDNLSNLEPPRCTAWLGTRIVRPDEDSDHSPLVCPDSYYVPQLRGGMPTKPSDSDESNDSILPQARQKRQTRAHHMSTRSTTATQLGPLTTRQQTPTPTEHTFTQIRLVYECGIILGPDKEDIRQSIHDFNGHPAIQSKCANLEKAGAKYLKLAPSQGMGLAAKINIPRDTELCYYIGVVNVADHDPPGNYSIDGGQIGQTRLRINATRVPRNGPAGCSMHMGNHGCDPNCEAVPYVPEGWNNDLVLLMLVSIRDIKQDTQVTFQYKGTMWTLYSSLPTTVPNGFRAIKCRCQDPCPNKLGRLDWIEPRIRLSNSIRAKWNQGRILGPESCDSGNASGPPSQLQLAQRNLVVPPRPQPKLQCNT